MAATEGDCRVAATEGDCRVAATEGDCYAVNVCLGTGDVYNCWCLLRMFLLSVPLCGSC